MDHPAVTVVAPLEGPGWLQLTEARVRVLNAIVELCADGWPTTIRDLCRHLGYSSTSTVLNHVNGLTRLGLVERRGDGKAGIRPVPK